MPEKRQLAAIMFTDIVGYTALMAESESKAYQLLKKNRQVQKPLIERHGGKWLKEMGDGVLASFQTISDAVSCAIEIQRKCKVEADLALRIGIHQGEVLVDEGDVFGDGVNIASRMEPLAPPGGIYVSESVFRNIENKEGIRVNFIGEEVLKNVKHPVKIYAVDVDASDISFQPGGKAPSGFAGDKSVKIKKYGGIFTGIALLAVISFLTFWFIADKTGRNPGTNTSQLEKSIAVLPFKNMSADEKNQAFCDGQWEAILSHLSKISDLRVISRQSTEQYRESTKTAPQIGEELRTSYIIEGSIQKYENQAKITVQFINAKEDEHIWSKEFTRDLDDIFSLQTEIAMIIADELEVHLTESEEQLIESSNIPVDIYDIFLSSKYLIDQYYDSNDTVQLATARKRLVEVINKVPDYSDAYFQLARSILAHSDNLNDPFPDTVIHLLEKAITLDDNNVDARRWLAIYYANYSKSDYDKSIAEWEKILTIDPNNSTALRNLGIHYLQRRNFEKSVNYLFKAIKNNPSLKGDEFQTRIAYYNTLTNLFLHMGMYEEAEKIEKKLMSLEPNYRYHSMAFLLTLMGRHAEALPYYIKNFEESSQRFFDRNQLAQAYLNLQQWDKAEYYYNQSLELMNEEEELYNNAPSFLFRYGFLLWQTGREEKAKKYFDQHIKLTQDYIDQGSRYQGHFYDLACAYAFIGETDKALSLLDQIPFWYVTYGLIKSDQMLDPIRSEPEFQEIMKKQEEEMLELRKVAKINNFADDLSWILER